MSILQETIIIAFLLALGGCAGRDRIKVQLDELKNLNIELDAIE